MKYHNRTSIALFLTLLILAGCSNKNEIDTLISTYKANPLSEKGVISASKIVQFAESSDKIMLTISDERTPWISNEKITEELKNSLLRAYVVGIVEKQLKLGVTTDQHCAGVAEELRVLDLSSSKYGTGQTSMARYAIVKSPLSSACI